jgi:hypothetical protein
MIRDDALFVVHLLRRFQAVSFPKLPPAASPAGLLDLSSPPVGLATSTTPVTPTTVAPPAAAAAAAASPSDAVAEELNRLTGRSLVETSVDEERRILAQAPGDLKSYWAKQLRVFGLLCLVSFFSVSSSPLMLFRGSGDRLFYFWMSRLGPSYRSNLPLAQRLSKQHVNTVAAGSVIQLGGFPGAGRSSIMAYAVMYARQQNWCASL